MSRRADRPPVLLVLFIGGYSIAVSLIVFTVVSWFFR